MTVSAIIVAAGSGRRMAGDIPKQYLPIGGIPVLVHTLRVFCSAPFIEQIFLVVRSEDLSFCSEKILTFEAFSKEIKLVEGGAERQDSVYNGLLAADGRPDDIVVIHDGVRPFLTPLQLSECVETARCDGACILGLPVSSTLKMVNPTGIIKKTLTRDHIWQAQTPQAFRFSIIMEAHTAARKAGLKTTDDAMLLELSGIDVRVIRGSGTNLKITTPEDLAMAEAIYRHQDGQHSM